ncbi:MAG: UDP-GlcNAc--UDP-phosphate GlcNAc-1-phosphate transferase [Flavobacteriales bacterium]|nr:UDP-GlcNAc--UDP-phosphate GlcNAc-1-phosphate transferase [Flavobacteriales bacterium]
MSIYLISLIVLLVILLIYLRLAKRYKIFDIPNNRSSHKIITIRGGGIVFPISLFIYFILSGFEYPLFMLGILIISIISFMDDIKSLQPLIRLAVQIIVVLLVLFELFSEVSLFYFLIVLFIMLGGLNAYNFMDGINGMTASYSLVILSTLYYINESLLFVDSDLIIFPLLSVLVFLFFNFRVKALCFSGDVGSLSLALLILFLLFKLIIFTGEPLYALFLIIYAVDSGLTLINRKLNGENVFKPHRSHLYQQLVHLKGYSHLNISLSYSFIQLVINYLIIFHLIKIGNSIFWLIVLTALSIFMYNLIKNILNER